MIANLTPVASFIDENMQTLQYASRAQHISNQPKINQDPRSKLILEQKEYIDKLLKELKMANEQIRFLASTQGAGQRPCQNCEGYKRQVEELRELLRQTQQQQKSLMTPASGDLDIIGKGGATEASVWQPQADDNSDVTHSLGASGLSTLQDRETRTEDMKRQLREVVDAQQKNKLDPI